MLMIEIALSFPIKLETVILVEIDYQILPVNNLIFSMMLECVLQALATYCCQTDVKDIEYKQ